MKKFTLLSLALLALTPLLGAVAALPKQVVQFEHFDSQYRGNAPTLTPDAAESWKSFFAQDVSATAAIICSRLPISAQASCLSGPASFTIQWYGLAGTLEGMMPAIHDCKATPTFHCALEKSIYHYPFNNDMGTLQSYIEAALQPPQQPLG